MAKVVKLKKEKNKKRFLQVAGDDYLDILEDVEGLSGHLNILKFALQGYNNCTDSPEISMLTGMYEGACDDFIELERKIEALRDKHDENVRKEV